MKTDNNIKQELDNLGIQLPIIEHQAFNVPNGYFENFPNLLMDNLKNSAFIDNLPKNVPQITPNEYFENFYATLSPKINELKPKTHLKVSYKRFGYRIAMAASMTLIFSIGFLMMNQAKKSTVEQELAKISTEEINQYIDDNSGEFAVLLSKENVNVNNIDIEELEKELFGSDDNKKQTTILELL